MSEPNITYTRYDKQAHIPSVGLHDGDLSFAKDTSSLFIWDAVAGQQKKVGGAVTSVAGRTGVVTLSEVDIANLVSDLATLTSAISAEATTRASADASLAPLASPALTGTPTTPTPSTGDNTTKVATTAFVKAQGYLTSAPVASVAGKTGVVTLVEGDVANLTSDLAAKQATLTGTGLARNTGASAELSGAVSTSGSNVTALVLPVTISDTAANNDLVETNTTTATSGTTNGSPTHKFSANYWTGAASAVDTWTIGSSLAAGTNGASTLTFAHSGSTGIAAVSVPALFMGSGAEGAPSLRWTGTGAGVGFCSVPATHKVIWGNAAQDWWAFGDGGPGMFFNATTVLGWTSGNNLNQTSPNDSGISRLGAGSLALGNGTASDVSGALTLTTDTHQSANGAQWVQGQASELLTLSTGGLTTDTSANLLPANAIIEAVVCRVTTTITTTTNWAVGDATVSSRFSSANGTLTAGTTSVGLNQADQTGTSGPKQIAAAKVRITCTGSNPGAGVIRITVFYRQFVAPTS